MRARQEADEGLWKLIDGVEGEEDNDVLTDLLQLAHWEEEAPPSSF